jgi:DNA-binding MarR family transcriptional regulator
VTSSLLALQRATHRTLAALATALADLDLTASETNALANLADGRHRNVRELVADTGTRATTLTGVLDRLERRGYVARELDPADRRSFRLTLTPAGAAVAAHARRPVRPADRRFPRRRRGLAGGVMTPELAAVLHEIAPDGHFGHRQHIQLAYTAVRRYGMPAAADHVCGWLRQLTTYERKPQKYHHTVSRAWVELVAHHAGDADTFEAVLARNPALLDKRLLSRHYRSATLACAAARQGWRAPDLAPLPGTHPEPTAE